MGRLDDLLAAETKAAEAAEADQGWALRTEVRIARRHSRSKTLQIRLNDHELDELAVLAEQRGLPVSTVARLLLLQALAPVDDLKAMFDRIERDLAAVRRRTATT